MRAPSFLLLVGCALASGDVQGGSTAAPADAAPVYAVKSSAIGAPTSAGTVFKVEVTQTVGGKLAPCSAYASVQLDFGGGNSTTFCDAGNCITSKLFICNITVAAKYALSVLADGSAVTPKVAVTVVPTAIDARASHAFGPALAGGRAQDSLSFWIQTTDSYGNNVTDCSAALAGEWSIKVMSIGTSWNMFEGSLEACDAGLLTVRYSVSVDGKYYILITLFGRELRGSPFKAVLLPAPFLLSRANAILLTASLLIVFAAANGYTTWLAFSAHTSVALREDDKTIYIPPANILSGM